MRISVLVSVLLLASASAASSAELLSNGSFELPALGGTAYDYPGNPDLVTANPNNYPATVNDWTYGGSAIVNTSVGANAWYGGAAPAGYDAIQFAALQAGSSLSQIFNSGAAGLGNLSWLSGGRPDLNSVGGNQSYNVFLNGNLLGTYFTTDGQAFTLESFANASLLAGSNTLNFVGLSTADGKRIYIGSPGATKEVAAFLPTLKVGQTYTFPDAFLDFQKSRRSSPKYQGN